MSETAILFPIMTLIGWTLIVHLLIPIRRFKAGGKGIVTASATSNTENQAAFQAR